MALLLTWEEVLSDIPAPILTEPLGLDWGSNVGQALGKANTELVDRGHEGPRHYHSLTWLQVTLTKGLSVPCLVPTHPVSQSRCTRAALFSQPLNSVS